MIYKQFALICCLLIILSTGLAFAQEDEITFDLNYLTKMHVYGVSMVKLIDNHLNIVGIPKKATNFKLNTSLGEKSYDKYSLENIKEFSEIISSCSPDYQQHQAKLPNEIHDRLVFNLSEESKKYSDISFFIEYDLPLDTKIIQLFRNEISLTNNTGKISIILPKGTERWYSSIVPNEEEVNNTLVLKWNNLSGENIYISYGSTAEYLFYENKKNSYLNFFMIFSILLLTILIQFAFYFKQSNMSDEQVYSFVVYIILISILFVYYSYNIPIYPFYLEYISDLKLYFLAMIAICLIIFYFLNKKESDLAIKNTIPTNIYKYFLFSNSIMDIEKFRRVFAKLPESAKKLPVVTIEENIYIRGMIVIARLQKIQNLVKKSMKN